ncbi:hypothetical protein ACFLXQ_02630 [Chloroflexota bacterium]
MAQQWLEFTRLSRAKINVALVIEARFLAMLGLQSRLATQPSRWAEPKIVLGEK